MGKAKIVDQSQIPTFLLIALNVLVVILMAGSFFRGYATKDDIKQLSDRLANVEAGQAALETRQGALETRMDTLDRNMREIGKKADASLDLHHAVRGDMKVLQASQDRLESYFETPKLKST